MLPGVDAARRPPLVVIWGWQTRRPSYALPQEPRRVGKTFERGGVWVLHHPVVVDAGYRGKNTPEGGVKMPKKFTSGSRLNTREVEAMAAALKPLKSPAPARIWMRGRWWWCQTC